MRQTAYQYYSYNIQLKLSHIKSKGKGLGFVLLQSLVTECAREKRGRQQTFSARARTAEGVGFYIKNACV